MQVSKMYIVLYSISCSTDDAEFITDVEYAIEVTWKGRDIDLWPQ